MRAKTLALGAISITVLGAGLWVGTTKESSPHRGVFPTRSPTPSGVPWRVVAGAPYYCADVPIQGPTAYAYHLGNCFFVSTADRRTADYATGVDPKDPK